MLQLLQIGRANHLGIRLDGWLTLHVLESTEALQWKPDLLTVEDARQHHIVAAEPRLGQRLTQWLHRMLKVAQDEDERTRTERGQHLIDRARRLRHASNLHGGERLHQTAPLPLGSAATNRGAHIIRVHRHAHAIALLQTQVRQRHADGRRTVELGPLQRCAAGVGATPT